MTATVNGLRSPAILATLTLALAAWSCGPPAPTPVFVASAKALGVSTQHCSGASGALTLAEVMGAGGALLDYDSDGDLDLYVVQSGRLDGTAQGCPTEQLQDRLYRNDLSPDAPQRFVDVTRDSGIVASTYGMGAAVGDYDRDGHPDVYVTALGANLLWRNGGDGTFEEVAAAAGVQDDRWSVPAAFVDFDRDGWLDLWVGNYADFRVASRKRCFGPSGGADYCGPLAYNAEPDRLFRNTHDGRFEDVTLRSGLRAAFGYALGVGVGDFDDDGWLDLYVANDSVENQLWSNLGDGRFRNDATLHGAAVNEAGLAEASMGVEIGDFNGDLVDDIFLSHLSQESNTLYLGADGAFSDASSTSGLAMPSWPMTGFGTAAIDIENDGDLDLIVTNGAVRLLEDQVQGGSDLPLRQPRQIFINDGSGRFHEASGIGGADFVRPVVGRGLASGDLDNDGDTDLVAFDNGSELEIYLNQQTSQHHWLGLELLAGDGNAATQGSRVEIRQASSVAMRRWARRSGGYATARDPRVLVGLGDRGGDADVTVHWASGRREQWTRLLVDRYHSLVEGSAPTPGSGG